MGSSTFSSSPKQILSKLGILRDPNIRTQKQAHANFNSALFPIHSEPVLPYAKQTQHISVNTELRVRSFHEQDPIRSGRAEEYPARLVAVEQYPDQKSRVPSLGGSTRVASRATVSSDSTIVAGVKGSNERIKNGGGSRGTTIARKSKFREDMDVSIPSNSHFLRS